MIITHKLDMDLAQKAGMPELFVVQGDSNTRVLELTLLENGEAWAIPEGAGAWMRYCKSDGTKGIYDTLPDGSCAWSVEENAVSVALAPQMLTVAGVVFAQVELVKEALTLASFTIRVNVERNLTAGILESEDYVNMLQWMEEQLDLRLAQAAESGAFDGANGEDGTSAYEYALQAGYAGTEEEFAALLGTPCLPLAGGTMEGEIAMGGQKITGLGTPTENTDAVTKAYVDRKVAVHKVTLKLASWSSTLPYTQRVAVSSVQLGDNIHILGPVYTGSLATDLAFKDACTRISYAIATSKTITFTCLESIPEADITILVECVA